ncbi:hypothetical protein NDU88_007232 [Pleurodeles waltl]|uniref:Uncharacterized protein n=1 Tax=Pleurodeles waltl TaxID=8319 RepID=A0AAV7RSJ6_PLEWA|nr:hypothetical protein NDU88_007232 [Pleurodeles waltl]
MPQTTAVRTNMAYSPPAARVTLGPAQVSGSSQPDHSTPRGPWKMREIGGVLEENRCTTADHIPSRGRHCGPVRARRVFPMLMALRPPAVREETHEEEVPFPTRRACPVATGGPQGTTLFW